MKTQLKVAGLVTIFTASIIVFQNFTTSKSEIAPPEILQLNYCDSTNALEYISFESKIPKPIEMLVNSNKLYRRDLGDLVKKGKVPIRIKGMTSIAFIKGKDFLYDEKYQGTAFYKAYQYFKMNGPEQLMRAKALGTNTIKFNLNQKSFDMVDPNNIHGTADCFVKEIFAAVKLARSMKFMVLIASSGRDATNNEFGKLPSRSTENANVILASQFKDDLGVMIELHGEPTFKSPFTYKDYLNGVKTSNGEAVGINRIIESVRKTGSRNLLIVETPVQNFSWYDGSSNPKGSPYPYGKFKDTIINKLAYGVHAYFDFSHVGVTRAQWDISFGNFSKKHPVIVTEWIHTAGGPPAGGKLWCTPNDIFDTDSGRFGMANYKSTDSDVVEGTKKALSVPSDFIEYIKGLEGVNGIIGWAMDLPGTITTKAYLLSGPTTFDKGFCGYDDQSRGSSGRGGSGEVLLNYFNDK